MTKQNYNPNKATPLYDQIAVVLGTVMTKTRELQENGIPVRTVQDAFQVFSRSAVRVSQGATAVSQPALGGFTN